MKNKTCCNCCCEEKMKIKSKKTKDKPIKVYFCPRCKSTDVGYIFTLKNVFGIFPKMRCRKCDFESFAGFPQAIISQKKLNSLNKKK